MKEILDFLTELKEHNNREWFEKNKERYLKVKSKHEQFLAQVIEGISSFDPYTGKPEPKECVFRIYRDVRFSKDKQPYKTHLGAFIAQGGRKTQKPGYYLHIEPGNSMIGGGIYMPAPDVLKKIRNEIYFDSQTFRAILDHKEFSNIFHSLYEDKITRAPKDYDAQFADIELLKYKSYFVERYFTDDEVLSPGFIKAVLEYSRAMLPLQRFLFRAFEL